MDKALINFVAGHGLSIDFIVGQCQWKRELVCCNHLRTLKHQLKDLSTIFLPIATQQQTPSTSIHKLHYYTFAEQLTRWQRHCCIHREMHRWWLRKRGTLPSCKFKKKISATDLDYANYMCGQYILDFILCGPLLFINMLFWVEKVCHRHAQMC